MARSFVFKFLSLAVRQPRDTVDDRCHFSLVILEEGQLRAIDLEEEICFRFGKHIEFTPTAVLAQGLPDQLISLSPDCQVNSSRKRGVRRKFVLADTSIKKFCVQLDKGTRFGRFRSFGKLIGDFLKRQLRAGDVRG